RRNANESETVEGKMMFLLNRFLQTGEGIHAVIEAQLNEAAPEEISGSREERVPPPPPLAIPTLREPLYAGDRTIQVQFDPSNYIQPFTFDIEIIHHPNVMYSRNATQQEINNRLFVYELPADFVLADNDRVKAHLKAKPHVNLEEAQVESLWSLVGTRPPMVLRNINPNDARIDSRQQNDKAIQKASQKKKLQQNNFRIP
ncbi:MAG: hypothetical protein NUV91_01990, partial [Candidatus Omnitrophica bacterium]|nr:hypothetical protein [Candidatus Omnitrophota bacterium]